MTKMHWFSNKFWKNCQAAFLNLQYWWPEVTWFDQIVVFQADCETSSPLRQQNDVTKI